MLEALNSNRLVVAARTVLVHDVASGTVVGGALNHWIGAEVRILPVGPRFLHDLSSKFRVEPYSRFDANIMDL